MASWQTAGQEIPYQLFQLDDVSYFPAHKTHRDFFVRDLKKKRWMYFNFSNLKEDNRIVTYQN